MKKQFYISHAFHLKKSFNEGIYQLSWVTLSSKTSGIFFYLSIHIHLSIFPSIHLSIYLSIYNVGQKVYRLFYVLAKFLYATSETKVDYITRKWMYKVPHDNNLRLGILGN